MAPQTITTTDRIRGKSAFFMDCVFLVMCNMAAKPVETCTKIYKMNWKSCHVTGGFMKQVHGLTWDQSSADEDVDVQTLLGKQLHLSLDELLGHLFSIAALTFSRLLHVHLQRLGSQGLKLLQGCGSAEECECVSEKVNVTRTTTTAEFNLLNTVSKDCNGGGNYFCHKHLTGEQQSGGTHGALRQTGERCHLVAMHRKYCSLQEPF